MWVHRATIGVFFYVCYIFLGASQEASQTIIFDASNKNPHQDGSEDKIPFCPYKIGHSAKAHSSPLTKFSVMHLNLLAIFSGYGESFKDLSWSPDGKEIATAVSSSATVWTVPRETLPCDPAEQGHNPLCYLLWKGDWVKPDTVSNYIKITSARGTEVNTVAWSSDGGILAIAGSDPAVTLWDPRAKSVAATLSGHTGAVTSITWSPDGRLLATASTDRTVLLWDVARRAPNATMPGGAAVRAVAFHPEGRLLASGGDDGVARVWSTDGEPRAELRATGSPAPGEITGLAWSPDGRLLAALCSTYELRVWDVETEATAVRSSLAALRVPGGGYEYRRLAGTRPAFSPDGLLLAVPRGREVWVLSMAGGGAGSLVELDGADCHAGAVAAAEFSPDGALLATVSEDGTARVWGARERRWRWHR